jgi:TPP-dependent pyruvate/acetoin dehydrogenase alpha subunit
MHMGDLKHNIVSIISALAATVPVAAGVAMALRYQGLDGVAFSYFGDGATSRGDWHEGVNFATVQKLPVVFICNNNQYAYSTPLSLQMACANVADRGRPTTCRPKSWTATTCWPVPGHPARRRPMRARARARTFWSARPSA